MRIRSIISLPLVVASTVIADVVNSRLAWAALDISKGIDDASRDFKGALSKGVAVAGVVIIGIGICTAAYRFSRRDGEAVWGLAGVAVGAALLAIAKGVIG